MVLGPLDQEEEKIYFDVITFVFFLDVMVVVGVDIHQIDHYSAHPVIRNCSKSLSTHIP